MELESSGVHLNNSLEQEYQDLSIDDVHCRIKKVVTEHGKMIITLESAVFTPDDAGHLVMMQQQGYCTLAMQSVPPDELTGTAH